MTRSEIGAVVVVVVAVFAFAGCPPAPAPPSPAPPPPKPTLTLPEQLLAGTLPETPEASLVRERCVTCHSQDYIVQQRLTTEQWAKSLAKMKKLGATLSDAEAATLATWLGSLYTPELQDAPEKIVGKAGEAVPEWRAHAAEREQLPSGASSSSPR